MNNFFIKKHLILCHINVLVIELFLSFWMNLSIYFLAALITFSQIKDMLFLFNNNISFSLIYSNELFITTNVCEFSQLIFIFPIFKMLLRYKNKGAYFMANLQLKSIKKVYDNGYEAVKDFNMDIDDKEFIVLVGPSGCGKTTTLRMIAGLEEITSGELYIGEDLVNDISPKDRDIAMVFQNYALYPHMTVYDNMGFALKLRKTPKDEIDNKVRSAAKILEIESLLNRKPKQLSGGQRQRVALGRAIVRNPKVFLMDEPLSNLDAKLRVQMRTEISKLHQRLNTTFIYVTHDQVEAMTMGTRIVIMKDGVIQQIDTPQETYDNPNNVFVASFIGSPHMNIFDGIVESIDGTIKLKTQSINEDNKEAENIIILNLPKEKQDILRDKGYVGKTVKIGIRPDNLTERQANTDAYSHFTGCVNVIELMGSETYVYTNINGTQCTARFKSTAPVQLNENIEFAVNINKIHVFDIHTEKTLF